MCCWLTILRRGLPLGRGVGGVETPFLFLLSGRDQRLVLKLAHKSAAELCQLAPKVVLQIWLFGPLPPIFALSFVRKKGEQDEAIRNEAKVWPPS